MWDSKRDTDIKNRLLDSVGEGEGEMIWENSIETCILSCEIDRQSRFNAWDRVLRAGALGWSWVKGWGGRWEGCSGWGTHEYPWLIHVNVWQNPPQYCKVISLQLNKNYINKHYKNRKKNTRWGTISLRMAIITKSTNNRCWRGRRKGNPLTMLFGMQTSTATMENIVEIPLKKTGNRTAIWPSNPTAGHTHQGNQNWKRHMYPNVHCSTV